jgi:hypothetical protein
VWLPTWLADSDSVVDRLVAAVDSAPVSSLPSAPVIELPTAAVESFRGVAALRSSVTSVEAPVPPMVAKGPAAKAMVARMVADNAGSKPPAVRKKPAGPTLMDGETAFVPWIPKTAGEKSLLDELPASKAARVVRRVLTAGIKAEGPIHVDRLARLTVGAFGLNRATEARKSVLLSLLPPSAVEGDYLWPDGVTPESYEGFRRQVSSTDRPLEHVPPEEIANAMAALCRASAGMRRDELLTQTAAVFGYKRRAASVTPLLEAALQLALKRGRLTEQGSGLITA